MEENNSRYVYLDNVRNNLVYLVVIFHAAVMFAYPLFFWWTVVDETALSRVWETFMLACDAFLMPHLIFLAVLFIFPSLEKTTVSGYLKKRFLRLVGPLLIFTVCGGDIIYQLRYKRSALLVEPTYLDTFLGFWKNLFAGPIHVFMRNEPYFHPNFFVNHTWFMSFLFAATLVIVLLSRLKKEKNTSLSSVDSTGKTVFKTVMIFLAFTLVYLAGILVLAVKEIDVTDWLKLGGFFTVRIDQGMQLVLFIIFSLYVYKKQWLIKGDIGSWKLWGVTSLLFLVPFVALLYAGYIPFVEKIVAVVDHNLFNNDNQPLPAITDAFKLIALVRYVLVLWICLSMLMFFISLARRFFNRPNRTTSFCSKHSIYVYVLHYVPVILLQYAFKDIAMPPLLKVAIISFIAISSSLWLSHRLVSPYPVIAIAFFVALKAAALLAGFTFYYYALLGLIFVAFAGAMAEGVRYFITAKNTEFGVREAY